MDDYAERVVGAALALPEPVATCGWSMGGLVVLQAAEGISVPSLPCPALVIAGREFPEERGSAVARVYGADPLEFPALGHFDLVLHPAPRAAIA